MSTEIRKLHLSKTQKPYLDRSDCLKLLYAELRKYDPLTQDEIRSLFNLYHSDDKEKSEWAFNKLCRHNMRLVISIARKLCTNEDNLNDLIQEGNMGLMKAIEMFDVENGAPFHGYAIYWIRRQINLFRLNFSQRIVQTNSSKTVNSIPLIKNELIQKLERTPTPEEILEIHNERYPDKKINYIDDIVDVEYVYINSLENISDNPNGSKLYTIYNDKSSNGNLYDNTADEDENREMIKAFLGTLTERESEIIKMFYGIDGYEENSFDSIALKFDITRERARQLYHSAINKMRSKREAVSKVFAK